MKQFLIVIRYFYRRHRIVLLLLSLWIGLANWLFAWMTAQTALREGLVKLMKMLPAQFQASVSSDVPMLLDPTGSLLLSLAHPLFTVTLLFWAIQLPLRHIASDQERGVLDVVFSRPISRQTWLAAIILAQLTGFLIIELIGTFTWWIATLHFTELSNVRVPMLFAALGMQILWSIAIGSLGAMLAAIWGRFRIALGGIVGFVLIMILWEVICRSIKLLKPYIIFSLWHWVEPRTLFPTDGWNWTGLIILSLVSTFGWFTTLWALQHRDLGIK